MIRQLELTNFKCFQQLRLPFRPLTLLTGINGSGKSTIIQSLLLLRQSWLQGLLQKGLLALNGDWVQMGTARDVLNENASSERIGIALTGAQGWARAWEFAYDRASDVLSSAAAASGAGDESDIAVLGDDCQFLSAERLGPRAFFPTSDFAVRQHRQLGTKGEFAAHFLSLYGPEKIRFEKLGHPNAASASLKDQVEAWLGTVCPGTRIALTPHAGLDLVQVEFSFTAGGEVTGRYRPTHVGFGLTYTLPILVAVLGARRGSLVILENPEAHLHPKGQAEFGRLLALAAGCGIQVVVESHSDHILNGIRVAVHDGDAPASAIGINFFERSASGAGLNHLWRSPELDQDGRIDEWPLDFFDQYDRSLEALLGPRKE